MTRVIVIVFIIVHFFSYCRYHSPCFFGSASNSLQMIICVCVLRTRGQLVVGTVLDEERGKV